MTKSECIAHIHALKNAVKLAWETTPEITAQEQEKRFKLIEAHIQAELGVLKRAPETAEWIDYQMCLLGFMTYGSSKNEKYLIAPTTTNHDDKDAIIDEYAITHALLTDNERALFLNRNHSEEWNRYLGLHPGMTKERYHQLMQSQQNSQIRPTTNTTAAFLKSVNNEDGGETAEAIRTLSH